MAKVSGPLLSMGGAGQVAKTQVYATWKGRQYVRRYVVPANPKSTGQQLTRDIFKYLFGIYRYAASGAISALAAAATASRLTTANMIARANLSAMRTAIHNSALILSPGSGGAPATPVAVATPGAGQISVAVAAPVLPNGWTATPKIFAAAVKNWSGTGPADVGTDYTMHEVEQDTPSAGVYTAVITGLTAGTLYTVVAWYSVVRPDGVVAYGVSNATTATPT